MISGTARMVGSDRDDPSAEGGAQRLALGVKLDSTQFRSRSQSFVLVILTGAEGVGNGGLPWFPRSDGEHRLGQVAEALHRSSDLGLSAKRLGGSAEGTIIGA